MAGNIIMGWIENILTQTLLIKTAASKSFRWGS